MQVYVSSHDRWAAHHVARVLKDMGHSVTATWLSDPPIGESVTDKALQLMAIQNATDVTRSDALVVVAARDKVPGGKFVEVGLALAKGIPVVIVGRRENLMMHFPDTARVDTPVEAAQWLTDFESAINQATGG